MKTIIAVMLVGIIGIQLQAEELTYHFQPGAVYRYAIESGENNTTVIKATLLLAVEPLAELSPTAPPLEDDRFLAITCTLGEFEVVMSHAPKTQERYRSGFAALGSVVFRLEMNKAGAIRKIDLQEVAKSLGAADDEIKGLVWRNVVEPFVWAFFRYVVHSPCTLEHGRLRRGERNWTDLGMNFFQVSDSYDMSQCKYIVQYETNGQIAHFWQDNEQRVGLKQRGSPIDHTERHTHDLQYDLIRRLMVKVDVRKETAVSDSPQHILFFRCELTDD